MKSGPAYFRPAARSIELPSAPANVTTFHQALRGYSPTRLVEVPRLAAEFGVRRLFVKEECARLGLPSFKILGASYAISRALSTRLGYPSLALPIPDLRRQLTSTTRLRLVTATDGNHGRAVARMARELDIGADIYFPDSLSSAVQRDIAAEGAVTYPLPLDYDAVVTVAAENANALGPSALLIQDTAWEGYNQIPQWIVDGYSTVFTEADAQLREVGEAGPDTVFAPVGVGSFAQAAVVHYRSRGPRTSVVSVEAENAPSLLMSLHAGEPVAVNTTYTVMAGLNCGTVSSNAWSVLQSGLDAAVTVSDAEATQAMDDLQAFGVDAGPCGAAALAGIRTAAQTVDGLHYLSADAVVVLLSTEGRNANPLSE